MAENVIEFAIRATDQASGQLSSVQSQLDGLKSKILSVAKSPAVLATATVTALGAMIMKTAEAGDEFAKLSTKTGISAKTLSEFAYAAKLANVDTQTMAMGMQQLSRVMFEAGQGSKEYLEIFQILGVEVKNQNGTLRNLDDVLLELADKFQKLGPGTESSALAMQLFGRSGTQMLPMLMAGKQGLADLRAEANRMGITFTDEAAKAAEEFNDNITRLKQTLTGVIQTIGNAVIPAINQFVEKWKSASVEVAAYATYLWKRVTEGKESAEEYAATARQVIDEMAQEAAQRTSSMQSASQKYRDEIAKNMQSLSKSAEEEKKLAQEKAKAIQDIEFETLQNMAQLQSDNLALQEQALIASYERRIAAAKEAGANYQAIEQEQQLALQLLRKQYRDQDLAEQQEKQAYEAELRLAQFEAEGMDMEAKRMRLDMWHQEQIQKAQQLGVSLEKVEQTYRAKSLQLDQQLEQQKLALKQQYAMQAVNLTSQMWGIMYNIASAASAKDARLQKQLAIANALIQAGLAIVRTMASVPFPANIIAAAGVAAQTAATIAQMKATPLAEGGIVTEPTIALIGEKGSEAVIPLNRMEEARPVSLNIETIEILPNVTALEALFSMPDQTLENWVRLKLLPVFDRLAYQGVITDITQ